MKRFAFTLAAIAALTVTTLVTEAHAQVSAYSSSTGGTAISTARGYGNTRLNSSSHASGGGYARSSMIGDGRNGGFASGNSRAVSRGGVAISNGRSSANGWGARSHSDSYARTIHGYARSDSNAIARGPWANARSGADTRTYGTYGRSSSTAVDNRQNTYQNYSTGYGNGVGASVYQNSTPRSSVLRMRAFRRSRR